MFSQRAAVAAFGTRLFKEPDLNEACQQQGRFIETAFGSEVAAIFVVVVAAAAAFVTKNRLPEFIELKMHFGHKWRGELNSTGLQGKHDNKTYESDQYSHNGMQLEA